MFKKILYPTDFSDVAAKALVYIKQLKEAGAQEVTILHVINQRIIDGLMRHAMLDKDILQWRKKAEEIAQDSLVEMSKELESLGLYGEDGCQNRFPLARNPRGGTKGVTVHPGYRIPWAVQPWRGVPGIGFRPGDPQKQRAGHGH